MRPSQTRAAVVRPVRSRPVCLSISRSVGLFGIHIIVQSMYLSNLAVCLSCSHLYESLVVVCFLTDFNFLNQVGVAYRSFSSVHTIFCCPTSASASAFASTFVVRPRLAVYPLSPSRLRGRRRLSPAGGRAGPARARMAPGSGAGAPPRRPARERRG